MSNVTYHYTNVNLGIDKVTVTLRGKAFKDPERVKYIKSKGFRWVYCKMRRRVCGWQAQYSVHQLIEMLLHLHNLGAEIIPSEGLNPNKWLYLDTPRVCNQLIVKVSHKMSHDHLAKWLLDEGYQKLGTVENPGDFAVQGDTFFIWTKQDDTLFRVVFDGESIESVAKIDPSCYDAELIAEATINGLLEREVPQSDVEKPIPFTVVKKYSVDRKKMLLKSFTKLDEKHPFFNMIKWD